MLTPSPKGLLLSFLENDRTVLESEVAGTPPYRVGDEITLVRGYRRGIKPANLPTARYRILALNHVVRRVENPMDLVRYEFVLQVVIEAVG
jgi:hypothetical protein